MNNFASSRLQALFEQYGSSDYIGEPLSIVAHSLQAAHHANAHLVKESEDGVMRSEEEKNTIVIAALLHDVGHIMAMEAEVVPETVEGQRGEGQGAPDQEGGGGRQEPIFRSMDGCGVVGHEFIAADFLLSLGLPARVANLVRFHVPAKRYLCGRDPGYYGNLSEASKTTLGFQGGPMTEEECTVFEQDVDFKNALLVRTFDEKAKEVSLVGRVCVCVCVCECVCVCVHIC